MTQAALGTWRKPPLVYVVAELVISPYYSMSAKVPGLQDRLRSAYPKTVETHELVVDGANPLPQPVWRLFSADQARGVQLATRSISLHATSYIDSTDFLSRWAEVLDAVREAELGAFIERAGLRYIDLIVPSDERSPADYVAPQLQGVALEGAKAIGSMWSSAFQFDRATVNLKGGAPAPVGMLLPPNFIALPLQKPQLMVEAEKFVKEEKPIGFIDTDCIREMNRVFEAGELVSVFTEMQKLASATFKAALSQLAKKEWS